MVDAIEFELYSCSMSVLGENASKKTVVLISEVEYVWEGGNDNYSTKDCTLLGFKSGNTLWVKENYTNVVKKLGWVKNE